MVNLTIYARKYAKEDKKCIVWISFYVNREKINFSSHIEVLEKDWSVRNSRVNSSDKQAAEKNLIIDSICSRITNVFVKYRLRDRKLTKELFLRAYRRPTDFDTFYDFAEHHQKRIASRVKQTTMNTEMVVLNKMKSKFPELSLDDIDREFLDDYYAFLVEECKNNQNTVSKNMTIFKKFVNAAFDEGYIDENPFKKWKIKKYTADVVYLTEEELDKLMKIYMEGQLTPSQHKTLQVFLFLCFSSLHIGDARRLQLEQFGEETFTYYRMKLETRCPKPVVVPISGPLRDIMRNMVGVRKRGPVIENVPADQKMNEALKEIAKIAGIERRLCLKVGRHTFATIFLRKTKDLACLKEIMGHSELRETLVYAHVLTDTKVNGVTQAFSNFTFC